MPDDLVGSVALVKKAMDACGSIRMVDSNATTYAEAVISCAVNVALEEAARVAEETVAYSAGQVVIRESIAAAIRAMMK